MNTFFKLSFIFFSVLSIFACKKTDVIIPDELKVFELTESVFGKTYNDLSIEATKYFYPLDFAKSPLKDSDGSITANTPQPLANFTILPTNNGGLSERSLTLSGAKPVFVPILGFSTWYFQNDPCDTDKPKENETIKDYLLRYIDPYFKENDIKTLGITLDGKDLVSDIRKFKVNSETFKMKVPQEIAGTYCPGNTNEAVWLHTGYCLLIKIPKGKHVLAYKADLLDPDGNTEFDFHTEVKWNLIVE